MSKEAALGFAVVCDRRYPVRRIALESDGLTLYVEFDRKVKIPPRSFIFLETPVGEHIGTYISPDRALKRIDFLTITMSLGLSVEAEAALSSLNSLLQ